MAETPHGATTTETGHPSGGHSGFPPFNAETFPSQILWFVIVFGSLYLLMSKIALPRVSGILATRQRTITGDLDRAANMKVEADAAGKAYEKTLADAKAKAQATAQETHQRLAADSDAKRKALEADVTAQLSVASAEIATTRAKAMANVDDIALEAASAIVMQLTGKTVDKDTLGRAITAAKGT